MPTFAITGGLGSGKTLVSVGRIQQYLFRGRRVATNLNLDLSELLSSRSKMGAVRLSDFPTIKDFECIGRGHYEPDKRRPGHYAKDEKYNGLIVLDECAVFFNSREWNDKGRPAAIAWLRHARKLGWDVIFITQDVSSIDKQLRAGLIEHEGVCKRADRLSIPFIGGLLRFLGLGFLSRPPRVHVCSVKYGLSQHALVVDRWVYRGGSIQNGYDTNQVFHPAIEIDKASDRANIEAWQDQIGLHSVLSPWHTKGRYLPPPLLEKIKMWFRGEVWRPVGFYKPKHPLVELCQRIPEPYRLQHWKRLEALGAFQTEARRWRGVFTAGGALCAS